jgi:hypothetical protein
VTRVEYRINRPGSATTTLVGRTTDRLLGWHVIWNTTSPTVANGTYQLRAHVIRDVGGKVTRVKSPPITITVDNP